jgi:Lamin Tail Domain
MRKRLVMTMLASSLILTGLIAQSCFATSPNIVISQIQIGPTGSASNEFIELYNNAETDIEISNWCLHYASATSLLVGNKLTCFTPENEYLHLYVPAHGYVFAVSTVLAGATPTLGSDIRFSATLAGSGHVRLVNSTSAEVDRIGWGTAALPEGLAVASPASGRVLARQSAGASLLQDSDNNNLDFIQSAPKTAYIYGQLYEQQDVCYNIGGIQLSAPDGYSVDTANNCIPPPVDVCTNIDGLQVSVPVGYALDDAGLCQVDVCTNIVGLQLAIADDKVFDSAGDCVDFDACINIAGIQPTVPDSYILDGTGRCMLVLLPLYITEVLPNAVGSDEGHEYVEIYNPHDTTIDLALYRLIVGVDSPKLYAFPVGSMVEAHSYTVFSDDDMPFTLVNSISQVGMQTEDGAIIDQTPMYDSPAEGMAWSLIDASWQFTDTPTPGADNIATVVVYDPDVEEAVVGLKPCAPSQYRSPETNRCRLLVSIGSSLAACKDGQYRSEATNRCRSIASDADTLTPCSDTQYRNVETNRCRTLASVDGSLVACKVGQERNPDTNRCRNVMSSTIPAAAFAVEPVADTAGAFVGWWALGGIGLVAVGYGVWEWRVEITKAIRRAGSFMHSSK